MAKQLRSFLKSLVLSCEAPAGEAPQEPLGPKRFQVLRGKNDGVYAQAAEEFARFLNGTFLHSLPSTVELLDEVLSPFAVVGRPDVLVLPTTWKARPKIGRWWEWLTDGGGRAAAAGRPMALEDFEKRFALAKRRFMVRVSAAEPIVMAYILWLILEDVLGATARDGQQEAMLALPSPADAEGAGNSSAAPSGLRDGISQYV
uniref:Uncharacterized protein n=1 Tax=Zooxanthella nutricula TaxID=1333877 RepID=A0A7S2KNR0_9DINO